ncbi:MAG: class I SAM-dependent methyltransferase [Desulfuromonadaceae bacterium]|nr:class I SAM-dependent methyltransferase [Desulfuromonadaceae bacterium]
MSADYLAVTELSGDDVTQEQIMRMCHRYYWAGEYCRDKDVLEAACGTGQGAGYLSGLASSYRAGDFSEETLKIARSHYGERIAFQQFDAQEMPFDNNSSDIIILFEALYYIPSAERFVVECKRVLRPGGKVLIATANKDLFDFNPSPHSFKYYGVKELTGLFAENGFSTQYFGCVPVDSLSVKQKILRPIKKFVVNSGLMPKTMAGKKLLKRLVFGSLVPMPAEIITGMVNYDPPTKLVAGKHDHLHKVIYCVAMNQEQCQ